MKATGIIRRVDDLGRIVIPKELRRSFDIRDGDPIEMYVTEDTIILKKYDRLQNTKDRIRNLRDHIMTAMQEGDLSPEIGKDLIEKVSAMRESLEQADTR